MRYRLGVDVGGTFTDIYLLDTDEQRQFTLKVPSTPDDPSRAIIAGVSTLLAKHRIRPEHVTYLAHGTTVATNTIVQRAGARVGMITTRGFRDLLEIARQKRPSVFDLFAEKPPVLVPRHLRWEVDERMAYDGTVVRELDLIGAARVLEAAAEARVDALAVCFLHSYANAEHERRVRALAEQSNGLYLSVSHELTSEFREYERFLTTVLNAYVGNKLAEYVSLLRIGLRDLGLSVDPYIIQSNGGLMSVKTAASVPIRTVLSGPAAGVVGAVNEGRRAGILDIITLDMGGTSTDVCLLRDAQINTVANQKIAGYPLRVSAIPIHTIGAGGGSIAWTDDVRGFHVGPQSAGAVPGPAAYGIGGDQPTVTDANVVLGRLNQQGLLAGEMPIYPERAARAVERVATQLGLSTERAAAGIVQIVVSAMVRAVRVISVEKGEDPRDFTLMAFGGAGALHASAVAKQLGIAAVCIPRAPGLLCSMGAVLAVPTMEYARSKVLPVSQWAEIDAIFTELKSSAEQWLLSEGVEQHLWQARCSVDMRYVGQNYELTVSVAGDHVTDKAMTDAVARFHSEHNKQFGYASPSDAVQIVNCRVVATGAASHIEPPVVLAGQEAAPRECRQTYFDTSGWVSCPVYWREDVAAGTTLIGPAVIEELDATTLIHPDDTAEFDSYGNIMITVGLDAAEVAHA